MASSLADGVQNHRSGEVKLWRWASLKDPYAWMDENARDERKRGSRMGTPAPVRQATKAEADEWWRRAVGEEVGESDVRNE